MIHFFKIQAIMLCVAVIFLLTYRVQADVLIVSDIDDTIRQSNTRNIYDMFKRYYYDQSPSYVHLRNIYKDIIAYYENRGENVYFYYLTSAPRFVDALGWLIKNNYPSGDIQKLPYSFALSGHYEYKAFFLNKYLAELHDEIGDFRLLMFGDNAQVDPLVYQNILLRSPLSFKDEDKHSFIRKIWKGYFELPTTHYFGSEVDLLKNPVLEKMISPETKEEILKDESEGYLVPDYVIFHVAHF